MHIESFRTRSELVKDEALASVLARLNSAANTLANCALFQIRNVLSSFEDGVRKAVLHEHQMEALALLDAAIIEVNAARTLRFESGAPARGPKPKPRKDAPPPERTLKLLTPLSEGGTPWQMLDPTVLDTVMRTRQNKEGLVPYRELPAKLAQQLLRDVKDSFTSWHKSLTAYKQRPASFTGRPRMPGYADHRARRTVSVPAQGRMKALPTPRKAVTFSAEDVARLQSMELAAFVKRLAEPLLAEFAEVSLKEVRVVPVAERAKLEAVFRVAIEVPDGSLAARFHASDEKAPEDFVKSLESMPVAAGADLGLNNLISLAFTSGRKGEVLSWQRVERRLNHLSQKMDAFVSEAMTPDMRALQARLDAKDEKLKKSERIDLFQAMGEIYSRPRYRQLALRRNQTLADALHKVSRWVVGELKAAGVELLVLGRNKGWKTESNMGKAQNRRFHATAHARLIELLRYKAEAQGILVVTTEESYTSKTSFVADEPLRSKMDPVEETPPVPSGQRGTGKHRHVFVTKQVKGVWARLHADFNGAFNILRKVLASFRFTKNLSPHFRLSWVSPKGLRPFSEHAFST